MKRINVSDRVQIKQLLYCDGVLAVKDDACPAFDGFELWWYDKKHDICQCCRSRWSDLRKHVEKYTLDHAASIVGGDWPERLARGHSRLEVLRGSYPDLPDVPIVRVAQDDLTHRMSEYMVLHCLMYLRDQRRFDGQSAAAAHRVDKGRPARPSCGQDQGCGQGFDGPAQA